MTKCRQVYRSFDLLCDNCFVGVTSADRPKVEYVYNSKISLSIRTRNVNVAEGTGRIT